MVTYKPRHFLYPPFYLNLTFDWIYEILVKLDFICTVVLGSDAILFKDMFNISIHVNIHVLIQCLK